MLSGLVNFILRQMAIRVPVPSVSKSLIDGRYYYMKIQLGWGGY